MRKSFVIISIILLVIVGIVIGIYYYVMINSEELVGGDKDEHGCIGSAGYSWCEAKSECLRPWEDEWDETCDVEGGEVPSVGGEAVLPPLDGEDLVACTMEAKICSDGSAVGRVAPDCEFEKCPEEEM